jgi:galactokinase
MDAAQLAAQLEQRVKRPARVFAAPGRVNLIGEHTDYNDGFVLPFAIERQTLVAAVPRSDHKLFVRSRNAGAEAEIDLAGTAGPRKTWTDYVEGIARTLMARGIAISGADLLLDSDIPSGAGLSSSAALEVCVGLALATLAGSDVDRTELALAGQEAEHTWVGTRCGIMDQMIVARGQRGHSSHVLSRSSSATRSSSCVTPASSTSSLRRTTTGDVRNARLACRNCDPQVSQSGRSAMSPSRRSLRRQTGSRRSCVNAAVTSSVRISARSTRSPR